MMAILSLITSYFKVLTLEPANALRVFGFDLVEGANIQVDLLMWKICHLENGYPEEICNNITDEANKEVFEQVQRESNDFLMISEWIGGGPSLMYTLFVGSLLDQYGCKPFLILPPVGLLLGVVCSIINYAFIEVLPLEFFYCDNLFKLCGGYSVYYLAYYSYGTIISKPEERANTLSRFDGFERVGSLLGVALSPIIFLHLGRFGNYGFELICVFISIVWIIVLIPNNQTTAEKDTSNIVKQFVFNPLRDMLKTLFKRRPNGMHWLILIQIINYATYVFCFEEVKMRYFFLQKTFDDFGPVEYALLNTYTTILQSIGLLVVFPIINKFRFHETTLLTIVIGTECLGVFLSAFTTELWQYYTCIAITSMRECKFALVRSLLSKCVAQNELGKMFTAFGISMGVVPLISNVAYRKLYNATLTYFPGAEILMAASCLFMTTILNIYLCTQKHKMHVKEEEKKDVKDIDLNVMGISHI